MDNENIDVVEQTTPKITPDVALRAATNSPHLAADTFMLGDRTFPILDLAYDDYLVFVSHLQPVFEAILGKLASDKGISIPGIGLNAESMSPNALMTLCGSTLPEMVCIMCKQSDPSITVDDVKRIGRRPGILALAVLKQVKQNGMIQEFADFFGLIAQTAGVKSLSNISELMTKATRSE